MQQHVYFVGTDSEIGHHAAPLANSIDYQIVSPESIAELAVPGDLAIFFSEHFDRFRDSIQKLKCRNVATLYMVDGILDWRNAWENRSDEPACPFTMRPVLSHKVAAIGNAQARILNSWGNVGKVEIVGIPRFDSLAKFEKRDRGGAPFRILVTTAKCPAYTKTQNDNLSQSLIELKKFLESQGNVEVVWRLTAGLNQQLNVENQLTDLTGKELAETLLTVDAVITTPSTAALESMLLDLPTAILDYNNSPKYLRSVWNITAASHLENQIAGLMSPAESKLVFQRQILSDSLQTDTNAADRMSQLVRAMLDLSKQAIENGHELYFPEQILGDSSSVEIGDSNFNHTDIYPEFPEFKIQDVKELQTQLAHSRREIRHLQSQLAQVQSELNQAHEIFDEINSHPIAGPVVKIRRKIVALLTRLKRSKIQTETNRTTT